MSAGQTNDARGLPLSSIDAKGAEQFEAMITDSYYYRIGVQDRLEALLPGSAMADDGWGCSSGERNTPASRSVTCSVATRS